MPQSARQVLHEPDNARMLETRSPTSEIGCLYCPEAERQLKVFKLGRIEEASVRGIVRLLHYPSAMQGILRP